MAVGDPSKKPGKKPAPKPPLKKPPKGKTTTATGTASPKLSAPGAAKTPNAAMQAYLTWYYRTELGLEPNSALIAKAASLNLPSTETLAYLRKYDPRYVNSTEYKTRAATLYENLRSLGINPATVPKSVITGWILGPYSQGQMYDYLRANASILIKAGIPNAAYFAGQPDVSLPDLINETRQMNEVWNQYYGRPLNKAEFNMFFNNNLTPTEVAQHADLVTQANPAWNVWEQQPMNAAQRALALFNQPVKGLTANQMRQKVQQAMVERGGLLQSTDNPFATGASQSGLFIKPGI